MTTICYAIRVATQLQCDGKIDQAKIILNSILEVNPTHAYALHLSGIIAYQSGDAARGIQLIQNAIKSHPTNALFNSNLCEMYRQLHAIDSSIQHGMRAVALDPNSATALSNLGIAYYDAKQYEMAEVFHKRALAINPNLACSLNNLGSIYKVLGKAERAIELYRAAIEVAPSFAEPPNNLGTLFLEQHEFDKALEYFLEAIKRVPSYADAHCNTGYALVGMDKFDEALSYFENALHFNSDYAEAYYGIARVYLYKHNYNESEKTLRMAIAINPKQVQYYQLLAEIYYEKGCKSDALLHLDHALEIEPTLAGSFLGKGNILMEMGEIDQAEEQFVVVTQDPSIDARVQAHYCLVNMRKNESNHPSLKALLTIVDNIQEVSPHKKEYAYFALGKCHDDIGEWKKAFSFFSKGCNLKRKRITYNIADQVQLSNNIISVFTKELIEHLRTFSNPSDLPLFIVGMPRSGTTLVEQIISSHRCIHGAGELTWFNTLIQHSADINEAKLYYPENIPHLFPEDFNVIIDEYLYHLRQIAPDAAHITDKMPHNFIAIGLIHSLLPNAKIIHVKRNPIDTCLSCYTKLFTKGQYYSYDLFELGQYYNCYENIMNHWRHILPVNAWLDVNYEDIIHDMEAEAKRLIAYCQLTWDPACLAFHESRRTVRTASFMQVRQPVYTSSVNRWRHFENELSPLIEILNQLGVQSVAQQQI